MPTSLSGHSAALPGRIWFTPDLHFGRLWFACFLFSPEQFSEPFLASFWWVCFPLNHISIALPSKSKGKPLLGGPALLVPGAGPSLAPGALTRWGHPPLHPAWPAALGLPGLLLRGWSRLLGTLSQPGTPAPQGAAAPQGALSLVASSPDKGRGFLRPLCSVGRKSCFTESFPPQTHFLPGQVGPRTWPEASL